MGGLSLFFFFSSCLSVRERHGWPNKVYKVCKKTGEVFWRPFRIWLDASLLLSCIVARKRSTMFVNMDSLYDVCLLSIMKGFDGPLTLEKHTGDARAFHGMPYEFTVAWVLGM